MFIEGQAQIPPFIGGPCSHLVIAEFLNSAFGDMALLWRANPFSTRCYKHGPPNGDPGRALMLSPPVESAPGESLRHLQTASPKVGDCS
jgi:hypothetical protein